MNRLILLALALTWPTIAEARIVDATFRGTVTTGSFDPINAFGPPLIGQPFQLNIVYDTSIGLPGTLSAGSAYGLPPNAQAAMLINGKSATFSADYFSEIGPPGYYILQGPDGFLQIGAAGIFLPPNERFISITNPPLFDGRFEIGNGQSGFARVNMNLDTFTAVSDSVPEPATWIMILLGFLCLGSWRGAIA